MERGEGNREEDSGRDVEWEEKGVIGDADPMVLIRKVSASELAKRRKVAFEAHPDLRLASPAVV